MESLDLNDEKEIRKMRAFAELPTATEVSNAFFYRNKDDVLPEWANDKTDDELEQMEELADFLCKMDSEGGLCDMIHWGGPEQFPIAIQWAAEDLAHALTKMEDALANYRYRLGITY